MSWLMRTVLGLTLAFSASAALAGCPRPCGYDRGYSLPTYGDVAQHYGSSPCGECGRRVDDRHDDRRRGYDNHGRDYDRRDDDRGPPPCRAQRCGCRQDRCGELSLGGFSYDGGVGPYPEAGYGGGGGYVMSGGGGFGGASASARASASASASSSSHVSINVGGRGGHRGGGCNTCGGGHGHK